MASHLNRRDHDQDFANKAFALKPTFQKNMLEMMSENLQLSFVKPRKNDGKSDFNPSYSFDLPFIKDMGCSARAFYG